jgi:hypothetical protein
VTERSSLLQGVQIGREATKGTAVSCSTLLNALDLSINGWEVTMNRTRPIGQAVASQITPVYEETPITVAGQLSYSEAVYLYAGLLHIATASTTDTTGKAWTFSPSARTESDIYTYTLETGGSVRAEKASFVHFTGAEVTYNRTTGVSVSGSGRGQALSDNITLTGTPTAIEERPILGSDIKVYVDSTTASLGTTQFNRDFEIVHRMNDIRGPVKPLTGTASFVETVQTEPTIQLEMKLERDSQGMGFLTQARAGSTQYVRVKCLSTVLAGAATIFYTHQLDFAGKISAGYSRDDEEGVDVATWTLDAVYDANWGKYMNLLVINKVATIA